MGLGTQAACRAREATYIGSAEHRFVGVDRFSVLLVRAALCYHELDLRRTEHEGVAKRKTDQLPLAIPFRLGARHTTCTDEMEGGRKADRLTSE